MDNFWSDFELGEVNGLCKELFLYSDNDALCPLPELEKLVDKRGGKRYLFKGSEHVMHFKMFGEVYERTIREFYKDERESNGNNNKSRL